MNADIAEKWAVALESGKYRQWFGKLRCHDRFCALGVLCDVLKPSGWDEEDRWDGLSGQLPTLTYERIGFKADDEQAVFKLNDGEKKSFVDIAAWIRENLIK